MVHDDSAFLVVNFSIDASVADEVDNPFLAFVLTQAKSS